MRGNSGRGLRTRLGRRGANGRAADGKVAIRVGREPTFAAVPAWLRPSFRDWCAECTDAPRAVAEQALVHVNTNRVEAAYMRSDLFEQRRDLMEAWGDNLAQTERAESG